MAQLTADSTRTQPGTLRGTGPPPGVAPPPILTNPPPRRHSRALWIVGIAVLAVVALVASVVVWALVANRAPAAPTTLRASATAMSVELTWAAGEGDVEVDQFAILRDGQQVGTVPGSQTSFLDEDVDLAPGVEYDYQVVAQAGSAASDPSSHVVVRTLAPSPVDLGAEASTPTSVAFHWSRPPDSPLPDEYVVVRDGEQLSPISGLTDYYSEDGLEPATSVDFQVIAVWGDASSAPSETLTVSTLKWAAPLQGSWRVDLKTTKAPSGNLDVGDSWSDTWTFTPVCSGSDCDVTLKGAITPSGFTDRSFTATLSRSGDVYKGTTTAKITLCGTTRVEDTLTMTLTRVKDASSGLWSAWKGTLTMTSPRTTISSTRYCPGGTWTFSMNAAT